MMRMENWLQRILDGYADRDWLHVSLTGWMCVKMFTAHLPAAQL